MFREVTQTIQNRDPTESELDYQIVGALLRTYPKVSTAAKRWGDPQKDSLIPRLDELRVKYPLAKLLIWAAENVRGYEATYSNRWDEKVVKSDYVGLAVEDDKLAILTKEKEETHVDAMPRAMLKGEPIQNAAHQLANLMVALNPPAKQAHGDIKVNIPTPCDPKGVLGCPIDVTPYVREKMVNGQIDSVTKNGGPFYQAYAHSPAGVAGIAAKIETIVLSPPDGTDPRDQYHDLCAHVKTVMDLHDKKSTEKEKIHDWMRVCTVNQDTGKVGLDIVGYECKKVFGSLETCYKGRDLMATTAGLGSRAGYIYDGHFFCDMPPGLARKVHIVGNVMSVLKSLPVTVPFVRIDTVSGMIKDIKTLLALNVHCIDQGSTTDYRNIQHMKVTGDKGFMPGVYVPYKGMEYFSFRHLSGIKPPSVSKTGVVYSPVDVAEAIKTNLKLLPPATGETVAYVVYAQSTLWLENWYVAPYNFNEFQVMVVIGRDVGPKTSRYVSEKEFLRLATLFFYSRITFPYSRMSWPLVSGLAHPQVTLKRGVVNAGDDTTAKFLSEMALDETFTREAINFDFSHVKTLKYVGVQQKFYVKPTDELPETPPPILPTDTAKIELPPPTPPPQDAVEGDTFEL